LGWVPVPGFSGGPGKPGFPLYPEKRGEKKPGGAPPGTRNRDPPENPPPGKPKTRNRGSPGFSPGGVFSPRGGVPGPPFFPPGGFSPPGGVPRVTRFPGGYPPRGKTPVTPGLTENPSRYPREPPDPKPRTPGVPGVPVPVPPSPTPRVPGGRVPGPREPPRENGNGPKPPLTPPLYRTGPRNPGDRGNGTEPSPFYPG